MSVYKRLGSKYYWTKFELNGKRIHKSTKTTNLTKALQWEAALRMQMQRVLVGLERDPMKNTTLREFRQRFLDEIRSLPDSAVRTACGMYPPSASVARPRSCLRSRTSGRHSSPGDIRLCNLEGRSRLVLRDKLGHFATCASP